MFITPEVEEEEMLVVLAAERDDVAGGAIIGLRWTGGAIANGTLFVAELDIVYFKFDEIDNDKQIFFSLHSKGSNYNK